MRLVQGAGGGAMPPFFCCCVIPICRPYSRIPMPAGRFAMAAFCKAAMLSLASRPVYAAKSAGLEDHNITLMDADSERLQDLDMYDFMTSRGNPTSIHDLKECGVGGADLFVAVTPYESINMTACMIANNLGVPKTLARIDNYEYLLPKNKEFFAKLGVDYLICAEIGRASCRERV